MKSHISKDECRKLRDYCIRKGLNRDVCILVDFSEYSGNERLYIYNLNDNSIMESGRVAHGIGKKGLFSKASFSNVPESWESSLGRYKTGRSRTLNIPQFKNVPCIEVHGLDPTNSNAHRRGIVIHPGLLTSKKTLTPCEPLSQGCFTVGQDTFDAIKSLTGKSSKPLLLYAYN
ncbi:MAG: murein L,D-transpeptidase catalytic domain family protein [Muribaculaceae bacterium]|nr:murein L,D-transpeptidase catalytic domain family protein [Muribaculaceae bacterium]